MADGIIDRIVASLPEGATNIGEFMEAVESQVAALHPAGSKVT